MKRRTPTAAECWQMAQELWPEAPMLARLALDVANDLESREPRHWQPAGTVGIRQLMKGARKRP